MITPVDSSWNASFVTQTAPMGIASPSWGISAPAKQVQSDTEAASPAAVLGGDGLFASIFQNAIDNVKETDAENVQAQYLLSTGQLDNPSSAMIAATKYGLSVDLLVQLRNKALDAYSELTRMSL